MSTNFKYNNNYKLNRVKIIFKYFIACRNKKIKIKINNFLSFSKIFCLDLIIRIYLFLWNFYDKIINKNFFYF